MLKALRESRPFAWALLLFQLFLVIIFFVGTDYEEKPRDPRNNEPSNESPDAGKDSIIANWYWYFNHIVMMMPIGFGYLVTFLRKVRILYAHFPAIVSPLKPILTSSPVVISIATLVSALHSSSLPSSSNGP